MKLSYFKKQITIKIMRVSLAKGKAEVYPIKFVNFMGALKVRGILIGIHFQSKGDS